MPKQATAPQPIPFASRATTNRLDLETVDPDYAGKWVEVRRSMTMATERAFNNALRVLLYQWAHEEAAKQAGEMVPPRDESYDRAAAEILALQVRRTNLDFDANGDPLPVGPDGEPDPTQPAFWLNVDDDVRTAVATFYNEQRQKAREARLSGEASSTPPAG